jgi:hypothetical protein
MDKFKRSLSLFLEQYKPRTILYIGKIFGEYYPELVPKDRGVHFTNLFLREPGLRSQEESAPRYYTVVGPFHMAESLDEALQVLSGYPSFDLILIDTVHKKEYIDAILHGIVKQSLAPYLILHDAVPHEDEWTVPSRSCGRIPWCGETYAAVYQFHREYPGTTRMVRDGHAGYAFIRLWDPIVVPVASPPPIEASTETLRLARDVSEAHEDFYRDALQSGTWVDAPAPSHYPAREKVQRVAVAPGICFHVFWKDFTRTENQRGPSLSLFVRTREKLKFDFQGIHAHYHVTDEKGVDSGRLPFSSSSDLNDQLEEMKTVLAKTPWTNTPEGHTALEDACKKIWILFHNHYT